MASWRDFTAAAPELAAWGEQRFNRSRVAFLATISADGSPRVNPVQPVICEERLLLFIPATSPKAGDLQRDGRYAMHSLIDNPAGAGGEFSVKGRATLIADNDTRKQAIMASCYTPPEDCLLFELNVEAALARDYEHEQWVENRWDEPAAAQA